MNIINRRTLLKTLPGAAFEGGQDYRLRVLPCHADWSAAVRQGHFGLRLGGIN